MNGCICLDSSVLIKLLVFEEGSEDAEKLLEAAIDSHLEILLPAFAWVEVGSVLRQKVKKREITCDEAEEAWQIFRNLSLITYLESDELRELAWEIASTLDLPTLYDAAYLAVAEIASKNSKGTCEFWTADRKLFQAAKGTKDYVRLLGQEVNFPYTKLSNL